MIGCLPTQALRFLRFSFTQHKRLRLNGNRALLFCSHYLRLELVIFCSHFMSDSRTAFNAALALLFLLTAIFSTVIVFILFLNEINLIWFEVKVIYHISGTSFWLASKAMCHRLWTKASWAQCSLSTDLYLCVEHSVLSAARFYAVKPRLHQDTCCRIQVALVLRLPEQCDSIDLF